MPDVHNSLRLGDLLVEKGLITRPQLRQAIEIQQALQTQRFGGKNINARTELGEILIELGFISRHQLQSNLNWQRRLRATTAVMVFIAPLLTAACGGGGGGGGSSGVSTNGNVKTEVASSQAVTAPTLPKPDSTSNDSSSSALPSSEPSETSQTPAPTTSSSTSSASSQSKVSSSTSSVKSVTPASSSIASSVSSSSSSKISSISSKSSSSQPASSSSSSTNSIVDGPVQLYWNVPNQRENGNYLDVTEIGGYEVRYKLKTESEFKTIKITDGFLDAYYFNYLKGDYQFQIATFDKEGLYSDFIDIDPS